MPFTFCHQGTTTQSNHKVEYNQISTMNNKEMNRRKFLNRLIETLLSILPVSSMVSIFFISKKKAMADVTFFSTHSEKNNSTMINPDFEPGYLRLHKNGELKRRGDILWQMMEVCELCPRECKKKRLEGQKGDCGSTSQLEISSFHPHFGEEQPLVMDGGSGTIFMTHCSLRCVYCINYDISILGQGSRKSIEDMAGMMMRLQEMGCENINVVTPTHYTPHIVKALDIAAGKGLRLPLVYNCSGYEKTENLRLLDGVVDIYLPDFKYFDGNIAAKYSEDAQDYPDRAKAALKEMHRQVGVAKPNEDGKMYGGLMIRHLVLPNNVSGTKDVMEWIAGSLSKDTYVNLMSQYRPSYQASRYPGISRGITNGEYYDAIQYARRAGLTNVEVQ